MNSIITWLILRYNFQHKYHQIRELMEDGEVEVMKVHTKKNLADILTKVLSWDIFHYCVALMGLMDRTEFIKIWDNQGVDC